MFGRILLCCCMLSGCATTYQDGRFSITGGYFEQPINSHLRKVAFYANGYTSISQAVRYAKFRCAEIANDNNKPYFIIYPSLNSAAIDRPVALPAEGSIGGKPAAVAYLVLSDINIPGAIQTSEVMQQLDAERSSYHDARATSTPSSKNSSKK